MENKKYRIILTLLSTALLLILLTLTLSSCNSVGRLPNERARLVFTIYGNTVDVLLTEEESARMREIFEGKTFYDLFSTSSCGFDSGVSIRFGSQYFCPACDTCNSVRLGMRYFDVSKEEIEEIHALFDKYGGYFPCI